MELEQRICAAYIRVSTHDQEEYSPESQIKLVRDYAKKNNMILPEEFIFRDDGISGRTAEKRPGFLKMIAKAKQKPKPFDCILVWKFSRFARNQEESVVYKSLLKKENGIEVISISEPLMEGPFGGLIERIIEWFDAFYSANLGTEVRRGMAERAGRGLPVSAAPLGYAYQDKELAVVPEEAAVVQQIYRDFLAGVPILTLARKLNRQGIKTKRHNNWEQRTVRYVLTNPVYIGKLRWRPDGQNDYTNRNVSKDTILVDGKHPPIISQEDFQAAQKRIEGYISIYKSRGKNAQKQEGRFLLQGVVRCGACGATLSRQKDGVNCSRYLSGLCSESHYISQKKLEALVLNGIASQFESLDFKIVRRTSGDAEEERKLLAQRIQREKLVLQRYQESYAAGVDSLEEYRENKQLSQARLQTLHEELEQLSQREAAEIDRKAFAKKHAESLAALQAGGLSPTEKNTLLRSFVDHITFFRATQSIDILFRE